MDQQKKLLKDFDRKKLIEKKFADLLNCFSAKIR